MVITNKNPNWRDEAKEGGFKELRRAIEKIEGTVVKAEFGNWSPDKEYLEVVLETPKVLEASDELSFMPDPFSFRVNCSTGKTSFWISEFLEAADKLKLLIPEDLIGKRIVWKKASKSYKIDGKEIESTNLVPEALVEGATAAPAVTAAATTAPLDVADAMEALAELAIGKTEKQFRTAASLDPTLANSPVMGLVKAGVITMGLVQTGKLKVDEEGVYHKV